MLNDCVGCTYTPPQGYSIPSVKSEIVRASRMCRESQRNGIPPTWQSASLTKSGGYRPHRHPPARTVPTLITLSTHRPNGESDAHVIGRKSRKSVTTGLLRLAS